MYCINAIKLSSKSFYLFFVNFLLVNIAYANFSGRYSELENVSTHGGESVIGECYFYSEKYGELDGTLTSSGESVSGEYYIYKYPAQR